MCLELETEGSPTTVTHSVYTFRQVTPDSWALEASQTYDNGAEEWTCRQFPTLEEAQQAANEFHCGPAVVGSVHTLGGQVFLCVVGTSVEQIEQTYHCTRIKPTIETNTGDDNAN